MSTVMSVVIPLLGVIVGAAGALLVQYLGTRVRKQQAEAAAKAAARAERKEAILAYLQATQSVEQAAERRYANGELPNGYRTRMHNMWVQQKYIELVGSATLIEKAKRYADECLIAAIYGEQPEGSDVWHFLEEYNQPFLAAARAELGLAKP
jgi:hypothetical protein